MASASPNFIHFPSSSPLLCCSYLRRQAPDQAGVGERLYFFKLFLGTGGCRHSKQHITAPQEIPPFGCPDVEALAGFRPIRACAHAPAWGHIDVLSALHWHLSKKNKQNNTIIIAYILHLETGLNGWLSSFLRIHISLHHAEWHPCFLTAQ